MADLAYTNIYGDLNVSHDLDVDNIDVNGTININGVTTTKNIDVTGDIASSGNITALGNLKGNTVYINAIRKDLNWDAAFTHSQGGHAFLPLSGGTLTGKLTTNGEIHTVLTQHTFTTPYGNITLGPGNTSYAHVYTDRPNFYFNKPLLVNGIAVSMDHSHPYDNYISWNLKANTEATGLDITKGTSINFKAGSNISISRTNSDLTISSSYVDTITTVSSGVKITVTKNANNYEVKHDLTPTPTSSTLSSRTYINGLTVDSTGHLLSYTTNTESVVNTNTATAASNILLGSNIGTEIKYEPYPVASKAAGRLYSGTTNPTNTTRLNYDGHFYGTKLFSGGEEVMTGNAIHDDSFHTHQKFIRITYTGGTDNIGYEWTHGLNNANIVFSITSDTAESHYYYQVVNNNTVRIFLDDNPYYTVKLDVTATLVSGTLASATANLKE